MCGARTNLRGTKCKKCACKLVYYCGKECQRGDWADHKVRCKKARATAQQSSPQEAIPGLPDHLVVTHVLRSEYFDDPADLARLPAVSRAMRDAVAATGLRFEELDEKRAVELGCLSALYRRQRQGRLSSRKLLCQAAARSGQLEELKTLRANNTPWDSNTCSAAARGGHLEVMQWACANGCPWDKDTCAWATLGRHLKVLQWARANSCPCWERDLYVAAEMGHEVVVRVLIEASADVNEARDDGWTPLCTGAFHDHEAVVRVLIELGANVNKAVDDTETALYAAADRGHQAVVRVLVQAGADINKAMDDDATPLFIAAQEGHEAVVRALTEFGADVNKAMNDGGTPLFIAAQMGHAAIVQILRDSGAVL